jgi:hypothetical protein
MLFDDAHQFVVVLLARPIALKLQQLGLTVPKGALSASRLA